LKGCWGQKEEEEEDEDEEEEEEGVVVVIGADQLKRQKGHSSASSPSIFFSFSLTLL
jgi:hypothetical protein